MQVPISPALSFCYEQAVAMGCPAPDLLAGTGLVPEQMTQPQTLISPAQELRVYRSIIRVTGRESIGLQLGARVNLNTVGIEGGLLANAQDLDHVGYLMRRFHRLSSPWFASEVMGHPTPGEFVVRYRQTQALGSAYRFIIDRDLRGTLCILDEIFGAAAAGFYKEIAFGFPEPRDASVYEAHFECPVRFGTDFTYVTYDSEIAKLRNGKRNTVVFHAYVQVCRDMLARQDPTSWHQKVHVILSSGDDYPKLEDIALRLGCSERSLRRKLHEEGFRYSSLLDQVRYDRATYMLSHSKEPVKVIAYRLGYSEPSSFVHAFKRWSGISPIQFRQSRPG